MQPGLLAVPLVPSLEVRKVKAKLLLIGWLLAVGSTTGGLGIKYGPAIIERFAPSRTFAVCIVEETADRPKLPASQLMVLDGLAFRNAVTEGGGVFIGCIDRHLVGPEKKVPSDLAKWIDAAKDARLPVLLVERGGKIHAYPITDEAAAHKAAGVP